ncbi:MAG: hypothetical protein OEM26_15905, partial [Saprospiraceae bacterium]|nr:hypothetical protein [Saprospiraceae bacterium]
MIRSSHSRFISFYLVLLLCLTKAVGQELPFTHYTPENESVTLPSAEVFSVFQDNLGYMWFVIYSSGLYRYNGHKADLYTESDGLPAVTVHEVVQDKFGRLWAGTNEGLAVSIKPLQDYRGDENVEFTTTLAGSQLVTTSVVRNRMIVDKQGRLLVGTEQAGVVRYDFPSLDTVLVDTIRTDFTQPGTNTGVRSMTLRQNGSIWVALADGQLCIWATGYGSDLKPVGSEYNPPSIETEALFEDSEGRLWGGCRKGLVWRLLEQGTDWTFETFSQDLQADIADITETQDGVIWIASNGSGVLRYEGRQLSIVSTENGLLSNLVNHMVVDREDNLWLAQSGGVSKLRPNYRAFSNYPTDVQQNGLRIFTSAALNAVLPPEGNLPPGGIWVGTDDGGMEHLSESGFEIIDRSRGLRDDRVNALIRDERGRLWVGTGDGIHCLSIGNVPPPPKSPEVSRLTIVGHNTVMASFEHHSIYAAASLSMPVRSGSSERLESLWFLGYQHLYCFVADQWFLFKPSAGLPGTRYHTVALDGQDNLWV